MEKGYIKKPNSRYTQIRQSGLNNNEVKELQSQK